MLDVVTMSSKGQLVIPRDIRESMGLRKQDKFILVNDKDSIILKRIKHEEISKKAAKLLDTISDKFEKAGLTAEDVQTEIKRSRK